ncbi:LuxR family transcriptional regulator [Ralstonia sp. A12]|uniref:response regulator transcription factor n=1 Tax=Ralstonia sp. A12 TaxID=1217052 RepID=UPI0005731827|nr:response regulator [Ralstonia sp. A12]KHK54418.1 LuxR family transcriptional regulator [Ralstonia sp. A12]
MNATAPKILCIEDDVETAELISEELIEHGYAVIVAHDGESGLAALLREQPDLVLCDVGMPGMTGFELLEQVGALAPRYAEIPFVFLTAMAQRESELRGRRLGADDYVTKPVDFEILISIVQTRLAKRAHTRAPRPQVQLSEREVEVLAWSARGKTSGEIATILGLSKRTVDFHIDNARLKLGVATRIEAVVKASSAGIIKP